MTASWEQVEGKKVSGTRSHFSYRTLTILPMRNATLCSAHQRLLVVAFAERPPNTRLISARRATRA
jgi:uncharacterized DUF497 family protein